MGGEIPVWEGPGVETSIRAAIDAGYKPTTINIVSHCVKVVSDHAACCPPHPAGPGRGPR